MCGANITSGRLKLTSVFVNQASESLAADHATAAHGGHCHLRVAPALVTGADAQRCSARPTGEARPPGCRAAKVSPVQAALS